MMSGVSVTGGSLPAADFERVLQRLEALQSEGYSCDIRGVTEVGLDWVADQEGRGDFWQQSVTGAAVWTSEMSVCWS